MYYNVPSQQTATFENLKEQKKAFYSYKNWTGIGSKWGLEGFQE